MTTTDTDATPEKLGVFPYILGGMSFIPLVGVLFGIVAIVWGLVTKKLGGKHLATVGAAGICFTIIIYIIIYSVLSYFGFKQQGGVYDDLRTTLAQTTLNSLVQSIEFYKVQHGNFPESLKVLQESLPKESFVSVFDPTDITAGNQPRYFYYEKVGPEHYYLRGVGSDGLPFTSDDIVPQISFSPSSKAGLLLKRQPSS